MHLFHKWIYLQRKTTAEFLGEEYQTTVDAGIRICKVCKKTQKKINNGKSSLWIDLNKYEIIILGNKLASKDVFKKETVDENKTIVDMDSRQ